MSAHQATRELSQRDESAASRRQRRIEAFHPFCRRLVGDVTEGSAALEDLAESFPALLFALATGHATAIQRKRSLELVVAGAPLRDAARALGVAWWLRKLPPQAFAAPLPSLPDDADFALHVGNAIPREPRLAPIWLARVGHACEACGPAYALWLARQPDLLSPPEDLFMFMAAWAWFGGRRGDLGSRLLRKPWHADMSFKRAREELTVWRQRSRLVECLGPGIETPWLADGTASGFTFVALRTVEDFICESTELENCLDQYADHLHTGLTALFSIRKGSRRVACVEIGLHEAEVTMPAIVQLRAARNRRAPPEVWQATFAWLGGQRLEPLPPRQHAPKRVKRLEARQGLWEPYLSFLAGTRHEEPFRRLALRRRAHARPAGRAPRRAQLGL
jgi:hypothetical protein